MQRILSKGEIESLDHTAIPRVRMPGRETVFATRATRLRQLAQGHPVGGYLTLMAELVDAQHAVLARCDMPGAVPELIERAQAHGMPPLQAAGWPRDPSWTGLLRELLQHLDHNDKVPEEARRIAADLLRRLDQETGAIESLADAVLGAGGDIDGAAAPFVMGALQVYWTDLAIRFPPGHLPVVSPFGLCPLCGSLPVASVVRVGGQYAGYRYLCCELCSTEWHMVRVTCSHCEDTKTVAYHNVDGGPEGIKAESCDNCHTYRKIFYQEKDLYVEPVADDLASLTLDVLMGEAGYARASGNPLLWQGGDD
ncbi:formate dehydrogenase accessory protein FdhE [Pigmentiphaga humi]|uniref:Protein FdhE homolog n=1 Tax=Pigmentiphaga humi TaxID=2478468 RepID=A0A3P4AXL5_9BURK|nr:formate dehydrogenase accessory protein FdhE [Pigmentiphaga humi]VCU68106.1 formate dehydrogenase accessory protein FdhE [Pigmentiphaga humi]